TLHTNESVNLDPNGNNHPPRIDLRDADTDDVLVSRVLPAATMSQETVQHTVVLSYVLDQTRALKVRIYGVRFFGTGAAAASITPDPITFVRRVMVHVGTQE